MSNQIGQQSLGQKVLSAGVGLIKAVVMGGAMGVAAALVSSLISKTKSSQVVYVPVPTSPSVNPSATQLVPIAASPTVITFASVSPVYIPLSCDLEGLPLSSTIVLVEAENRTFPAICLSDTLQFTCAGKDFQVSMDVVNKIEIVRYGYYAGDAHDSVVILVDGSKYVVHHGYTYPYIPRGLISDIEFVTVAGLQTVSCGELYSVKGASDLQLDVLKYNLELAFQANLQSIINTVGKNLVSHFFTLGQFNVPGLQQTPIALIAPSSIPPAPSGLSGKAVLSFSNPRIDLSWTAVNGATGYNVYRDTSASSTFSPFTSARLTSTANTWYCDTNVRVSTLYYYRVTAYNNTGESAVSPVLPVVVP